jgi:hypothetical protein
LLGIAGESEQKKRLIAPESYKNIDPLSSNRLASRGEGATPGLAG